MIYALFAIAVGAAVLAGWLFDLPLLKSLLPGFVTMKANTALAFVLAGGSLLLLSASPLPPARARTGQVLALIVVLIGALTLVEYVFGWRLGIDELLFRDTTTEAWKSSPGRMAASSAAAFFLLGMALLAFEWEPRRGLRPAELLALLVIALSSLAAIEYAFGHAFAYPFFQHTRMALHTFMTFVVLGAGVLTARPAQGVLGAIRAGIGNSLERRVYVALAIGLAALLLAGSASFFSVRDSITRAAVKDRAREVQVQLVQLLSSHQDIQTGQRGYAITGDEDFLQPYLSGVAEANRNYRRLAALVQDNPLQAARVASLETLHRRCIEFAARVVETRRSGDAEAAVQMIAGGEGRRLMDDLRAVIAMMGADQMWLLSQNEVEDRASVARLNWMLFASLLLALFVVVFASVVIHRDFSRRHRAEAALRESEESLATTLQSIGDAVLATDTKGRVTRLNPVAERLTGWPLVEARGRPVDEVFRIVHEETRAPAVVPVAKVLATGELQGLANHTALIARDGTEHPIADSAAPIRDPDGRVSGVVLVFRDVTVERRTEHFIREQNALLEQRVGERTVQLRESEARLSFALQKSRTGGWDLDLVDHSAHRTLEHDSIFGYESLLPQWTYEMFLEHVLPEDRAAVDQRFRAATAAQAEWNFECRIRRADGEVRWILAAGEHQRDHAGQMRRMAGIVQDITELKRAEQRLHALNEDLERRVAERTQQLDDANRAKSQFLATMSHEIRTPMNGVIGMVDVLHQTSLRGYQVEMVDLIRESAYSLLSIIDDILDFSKIEAGKLEIDSQPVDIAAVVKTTCGMLEHLAARKGVELTIYVDPEIPAAMLGDAARLRQILLNLVGNAIKFSSGEERQGRVSMRAVLAKPGEERAVVEFRVVDNGIGMSDAIVAKLFTPFTQADASTTRQFGGTGLGLTIARHLIGLMGGEITVESEPGRGSTFCAQIPLLRTRLEPAEPEEASTVTGLHCIVVGGTEGMSDDLASYLAHAGAVVTRAPNLAYARAEAARQPPGQLIWVVDSEQTNPPPDELRAAATGRTDADNRFVLVGRGQRRRPRSEAEDLVTIDGNALTRRTFLNTVALAAGRSQLDDTVIRPGMGESEFRPPERLQAARTGKLILVAEDNETNQQVILRQLSVLGLAADFVSDGREALERWESGSYALLLTDLHMPRMDGYDLARSIRLGEAGQRRIPIVALTANALAGEAERCRAAGMDDYLSKPAPLAELRAMLEKWLPATGDTHPQQQAASAATADSAVPVEPGILAGLVGDDPAAQQRILDIFRGNLPATARDLRDACKAGDAARASAAAHKLKSSARSIGALTLGNLCAELEKAGRAGDAAMLDKLLPRFLAEVAAVQADLEAG